MNPSMVRMLIFLVLFMIAVSFSLRKPVLVLYSLLLYLPFMGFIRRWLIPHTGWSGFDPLVVLAPSIVLLIASFWLYRTYVMRESIIDDTTLFKLIRYLLLIEVLQIFNPLQGSLIVGLGGVIFYIAPLAWMLMGRYYVNAIWLKRIFFTISVMGVFSILYSLKQVHFGFFSFEEAWIEISGYAALMVGQNSRGFSFFTSAAEYAQYALLAAIICWVYVLRGKSSLKIIAIALLPLFFYGLLMTGSRTPLIMFFLSIGAITIMNVGNIKKRVLTSICVIIAVIISYQLVIAIDAGDNALIARQVNGLTNPTDEEHSTLGLHWNYFLEGMKSGFTNPIGTGLGSTTLAGMKFSEGSNNSEVDISNMFTSNGLIGGILYLAIVFHILRLAFRHCRDNNLMMCIFGVLISTFGSWAIGGNYSTVTIIWLCVGYLDGYSAKNKLSDKKVMKI